MRTADKGRGEGAGDDRRDGGAAGRSKGGTLQEHGVVISGLDDVGGVVSWIGRKRWWSVVEGFVR